MGGSRAILTDKTYGFCTVWNSSPDLFRGVVLGRIWAMKLGASRICVFMMISKMSQKHCFFMQIKKLPAYVFYRDNFLPQLKATHPLMVSVPLGGQLALATISYCLTVLLSESLALLLS